MECGVSPELPYPRHITEVLEKAPGILLLRLAVEDGQREGKEDRPAPHHEGEDHAHEGDALLVRFIAQDHERLCQVLGKSPVCHMFSRREDPLTTGLPMPSLCPRKSLRGSPR